MKKHLSSLNLIALIVTVFVSYLSNSGLLNGETMGSISGKYHSLFTPAGYAFSIWGFIYLGLFGFAIYNRPFKRKTIEQENIILKIGWWFILSSLANSLWVIAWIYEYILLSVFLMIILFLSLMKIVLELDKIKNNTDRKAKIFTHIPFHIYTGWISVALIANIAAYLKMIQWNGFGLSETFWAVVMIGIASAIHVYTLWSKRIPAFTMVIVWTLIAIAFSNNGINQIVVYTAIVSALVIFGNISFVIYKERLNEN